MEWQAGTSAVALTQRATRSVVHHQKRNASLQAEVQYTHNVGMYQASNGACLSTKLLHILVYEGYTEHLDGRWCPKMNMLAQIDFGEAPTAQQAGETIVAQLFPSKAGHLQVPPEKACRTYFRVDYKFNVSSVRECIEDVKKCIRLITYPLISTSTGLILKSKLSAY